MLITNTKAYIILLLRLQAHRAKRQDIQTTVSCIKNKINLKKNLHLLIELKILISNDTNYFSLANNVKGLTMKH